MSFICFFTAAVKPKAANVEKLTQTATNNKRSQTPKTKAPTKKSLSAETLVKVRTPSPVVSNAVQKGANERVEVKMDTSKADISTSESESDAETADDESMDVFSGEHTFMKKVNCVIL